MNDFYKARNDLQQSLKREVTDKEICDYLNINEQQLANIYDSLHYLASVSLEEMLFSSEDDGVELKDTIQDESMDNALDILVKDEQQGALEKAIAILSERDQLILSLYYKEELTLKEISEVLDISIARVSQLHGKIISKLRESIQEELA